MQGIEKHVRTRLRITMFRAWILYSKWIAGKIIELRPVVKKASGALLPAPKDIDPSMVRRKKSEFIIIFFQPSQGNNSLYKNLA
jgi:hypothetical protein